MKEIIVFVLVANFLTHFTLPAFAQYDSSEEQEKPKQDQTIYTDERGEKFQSVRGKILAIDRGKSEILLDEDFTHEKRIIAIPKERLENFSVGNHVRIRVKLNTNIALKIVKIRLSH
ncbi:MAG: hypothetical protein V1692_01850 [bacterium]